MAQQQNVQQARPCRERQHGTLRAKEGHFPKSTEFMLAGRHAAVSVCRGQGPAGCGSSCEVQRRFLWHATVALCQDWASPLQAVGCPLGPQQDPAEFVAQLAVLLGPKWLQVAGVQRTEVKALVPQCPCYGAD